MYVFFQHARIREYQDSDHPFSIEEDSDDVPLSDCWYARPAILHMHYVSKEWKTAKESKLQIRPR
jgi:hypothetical protein